MGQLGHGYEKLMELSINMTYDCCFSGNLDSSQLIEKSSSLLHLLDLRPEFLRKPAEGTDEALSGTNDSSVGSFVLFVCPFVRPFV